MIFEEKKWEYGVDFPNFITLSHVLVRPKHPHKLYKRSKIGKTLGGLLLAQLPSGRPGIGDAEYGLHSL